MVSLRAGLIGFAALTAASSTIGFAQPPTPPREIVQVKGDLYRTVESLDFDVLVPGHGSKLVDKTLVRETREYFEGLRTEVAAGMAAGQSLEQLKVSVKLERYKDWANYQRLRAYNIEAAYRNLLTYR